MNFQNEVLYGESQISGFYKRIKDSCFDFLYIVEVV